MKIPSPKVPAKRVSVAAGWIATAEIALLGVRLIMPLLRCVQVEPPFEEMWTPILPRPATTRSNREGSSARVQSFNVVGQTNWSSCERRGQLWYL